MPRFTHLYLILILCASAARVTTAGQPNVDLFRGSAFNVARVHLDVTYPADTSPSAARFSLAGEHTRVLYPVFFADSVPVGAAGTVGSPRGFQLLFLYRGSDPFGITVTTNLDSRPYGEYHASIDPATAQSPGEAQRLLLSQWWKGYRAMLESAGRRDAYYPVVEKYLSWHLPRRLELSDGRELAAGTPTDLLTRPLGALPEVERLADLFMGSESIRAALQRDVLLQLSESTDTELTQPLPPPVRIPAVSLPKIPPHVEVEAMASFVPAECLYVRFSSFASFRAIRVILEKYGGQLHDLILGRAFDARVKKTLETQLALGETALSKLFGDLAVTSVALVAQDTFVREGSALGFLFEAKNDQLLRNGLARQRDNARKEAESWSGAEILERSVEVGAGSVLLLEAPGNRVRSFYAVAGVFHFVTNCERLAKRFLECASGTGDPSLAQTDGFRHARHLRPIGEPEDVFIFISDPFVREIVGPAYRAEMTRRTRSRAEMELIEVARHVARAETGGALDMPALVEQAYIPRRLLDHPDGTKFSIVNGHVVDSLRGQRGTFLPIPDVEVDRLSRTEVQAYESFRNLYRRQWGRVDPVSIRINLTTKKNENGESIEDEVRLEVDILPFARRPYEFLTALVGPASTQSFATPRDEIVGVEIQLPASLGGALARGGVFDFEPPLLFGGLAVESVDFDASARAGIPYYAILPATASADGTLQLLLGAAKPVGDGELYSLGADRFGREIWVARNGGHAVLAPKKDVALRIAKTLTFAEADAAQARLQLSESKGRRIALALDVASYERLRRASRSGGEFLTLLHRELKVPLAECPAAAVRILGMTVSCPVAGEYRPAAYPPRGGLFFRSDPFPEPAPEPAEVLRRAQGLEGRLSEVLLGLDVALRLDGRSLHSDVSLRLRPEAADDD